jgi:hypothetical protein
LAIDFLEIIFVSSFIIKDMYTKNEVIEMITRQFNVKQTTKEYICAKMNTLSVDDLKREFNKASLGAKLIELGYNRFQITF